MVKKMLGLILVSMVLSGVSMTFALDASEVTATDKDGYILYSLCSGDAKLLQAMGETSSESIQILKNGSTVKYIFHEHILSCGTHMNGTVTEVKKDGKLIIKGDFDVTRNPYKIKKLLINLVNDLSAKTVTGTLTIDGRELDVNLLK